MSALIAKKRRICYVSGTRADFGLMELTLKAISKNPFLHLDIVVTGMHLSPKFGNTIDDILRAGLKVSHRIPVDIDNATGAGMAKNLASTLSGCVEAFTELKPDIVIVLGDRGEMLAAAIAAIHLNLPIAHIHGGERSGTVDEPIRHAISKLSHIHFVSSEDARTRLVRMGEHGEHVFISGAPGIDGLIELASIERDVLCKECDFNPGKPIALMVFHPVHQEAGLAERQACSILEECFASGVQVMALMPNSDSGSDGVRRALLKYQAHELMRIRLHLPRQEFVSWMAACDLMIGNSSSGIIEAGTFGTPVINIGSRQNLRERNPNVIDVSCFDGGLSKAIRFSLGQGRLMPSNLYGDGNAAEFIVEQLSTIDLTSSILFKTNAY